MWLINGNVYLAEQGFQKRDLLLRNGMIERIVPCGEHRENVYPKDGGTAYREGEETACPQKKGTAYWETEETVDAQGDRILPGLVDIHFHGCAGHDFCEGTAEAFSAIEEYELRHGITTIVPATMTLPEERIAQICSAAAAYAENSEGLRGIYLEGPFLSEAKKGAQNGAWLKKPDAAVLRSLMRCAGGLIRIAAIAPEIEGALACIEACAAEVRFSVAHTTADYTLCAQAMRRGARQVTHLYNAMPPFTHREPGVIGAAFDHGADVELISDGVHVDACAVRVAFRLFGEEHVILISDSMMAAGMPDGMYELGGQAVRVCGKRALLSDGTIAGSVTNLYDCMVTAVGMGIAPEAAVRAATQNPAAAAGVDADRGSIAAGKRADLLVVGRDWELKRVYRYGREVPLSGA